MQNHIWLLLLLCALTPFASGCSLFRGACATALPVITSVQSYVHDATIAIDQAEAAFSVIDLGPEAKKQVAAAIAKARETLRVADKAARVAAETCEKPDVFSLLQEFISAWAVIEPLLVQHSDKLGAAPGVPAVITPAVVLEARSRGAR